MPNHQKKNKNLIKGFLLILGIGVSFFSSFSFANDCSLFQEMNNTEYTQLLAQIPDKNPLLKAFPKPAIKLALLNLHAYCCKQSDLQSQTHCQATKANRAQRDNLPESLYLFDHLFDLQMRMRSNQSGNYLNFPHDPLALERTNKLQNLTLQSKWALPTDFSADYQKYRGLQTQRILPNYEATELNLRLKELVNEKNTKILTQFPSRNLRTKFLNTCSIASSITAQLSNNPHLATQLASLQSPCANFISQYLQLQQQNLLSMLLFKSNKLLSNTIRDYGNAYFSSRANNLISQLNQFVGEIQGVSRQISHLTPTCN